MVFVWCDAGQVVPLHLPRSNTPHSPPPFTPSPPPPRARPHANVSFRPANIRSCCFWTKNTHGTITNVPSSVKEWGRSSLALLDVREEAHRLSAELLQLGPRGRSGSSGGKGMDSRRLEGEAVERLLREIEEKVGNLIAGSFIAIGACFSRAWQCFSSFKARAGFVAKAVHHHERSGGLAGVAS